MSFMPPIFLEFLSTLGKAPARVAILEICGDVGDAV